MKNNLKNKKVMSDKLTKQIRYRKHRLKDELTNVINSFVADIGPCDMNIQIIVEQLAPQPADPEGRKKGEEVGIHVILRKTMI